MVSPRLRSAVPLPSSVDTTRLRRVLGAHVLVALAAWVLPALLTPPEWLSLAGIADPLVFLRLWGAASFAGVVGQAFTWRSPARHPLTLLVTIVADAMSAVVIVSVGAAGAFAQWSSVAQGYVWGSAIAMVGFALALTNAGRPLLQRLTERPRSGSTKVM